MIRDCMPVRVRANVSIYCRMIRDCMPVRESVKEREGGGGEGESRGEREGGREQEKELQYYTKFATQ